MSQDRLADYIDHMWQASRDACDFVEDVDKAAFLADKRTQQAVIMSLVIVGEAATKVMNDYTQFARSLRRRKLRGRHLSESLRCVGWLSAWG